MSDSTLPSVSKLVGQTIDGRYRIERILGQGGMGTVFEATQVSMDRRVALKVLNPAMTQNEQAVKRFNREMKISSRVEHPNTIQVFDYGQLEDQRCYLVVEYLEGTALGDILDAGGKFTPDRVVAIGTQVLMALGAAHEAGIVHRDLKPDNIMLVPRYGNQDFVKVLDFGIARVIDKTMSRLTATGAILGTPYYMSSEQAAGETVDHRSDLYSFGIVLYEMVVGQRPFDGESMVSLLVKHVQEAPRPPNEVRPGCCSKGMEELILGLIAKDPKDRPQTAAEAAALLAACETSGMTSLGKTMPGSPDDNTSTGPSPAESQAARTKLAPLKTRGSSKVLWFVGLGLVAATGIGLVVMGGPEDDRKKIPEGTRQAGHADASSTSQESRPGASLTADTTHPPKGETTASKGHRGVRAVLDATYAALGWPAVPTACQATSEGVVAGLSSALRSLKSGEQRGRTAALASLEQIEVQGTRHTEYWTLLALLRVAFKSDSKTVLEAATKAVSTCRSYAMAHHVSGNGFQLGGNTDKAVVAYDTARILAPDFSKPAFNRALMALKRDDVLKAISLLDGILKREPDYPGARMVRGRAHYMGGHYSRALADLDASLQEKPSDARAWYIRGMVRRELNDPAGARADFCGAAQRGELAAVALCPTK